MGDFFFISKKMYIQRATSRKTKGRARITEKETNNKKRQQNKQKPTKELSTEQRIKERRERITRGDSPSPSPIKKRTTKESEQLIIGFVHIFKGSPIPLPPDTPHKTQRS